MARGRKRKKGSQPSQAAKEACNHEEVDEGNDSLQGDIKERSSDEDIGDDPILEPKHKIFLSHSGAQKEFVEHLCQALEARCHYPFYDRRHHSLPKGERFPELIVQAAEQCKMLIVVVSDEYFMSKWPMIELNAFVRAHKLSRESKSLDGGPKILPLFYGLSVSDLADKVRQRKWFREWQTLAKKDPKKRIVVNEWKSALDILGSFNGLVYDRVRKEITAYETEIVSVVCKAIVPDIKWDDSHVQGKSSICKVIRQEMEAVGISKKYQVKVVGIYGVGGIGKTTTCHTLCNELLNEYEGRVCHIEFQSEASKDSKELLQKVLIKLSGKSGEAIQPLDEGQCKDILYKSLSKHRIFLAIDNVWDDLELRVQAMMYLEAPYHKDSLVMVTSRSKGVLKRLGIDGDACFEMPDIGKEDAVKLFLQHAAGGMQEFEAEEMDCVLKCVRRCYFSKGGWEDGHYHPLSLKVLGLLMSDLKGNPREWVKYLPRVRNFSDLSNENPVFDILRSSFDVLPLSIQTLFMDVGFIFPIFFSFNDDFDIPMCEWLCDVHRQDEAEIKRRLDWLKRRGLLQDVDLVYGEVSMHDLYREFGELELRGKLKESTDLGERQWVYVDSGDMMELQRKPAGRCWQKLTRLTITSGLSQVVQYHLDIDRVECGKGIKWKYFSNVEVLQLKRLDWEWGALNLEPMVGLRTLYVCNVRNLYRIEGLKELSNLIHIYWKRIPKYEPEYENIFTDSFIVGQLPSSLKYLEITGAGGAWGEVGITGVWGAVGPDLLTRCSNLLKLVLEAVTVDTLDLKNCPSLDSVGLWQIEKCQALLLPGADRPSCIRSLQITCCIDLVRIAGIDHLTNLRELRVHLCRRLKVPSLLALTQLQVLELCGELSLELPGQLQELRYVGERAVEKVNLDGFNQLGDLDLSGTHGLTSLEAVGGLPALRYLNLSGCENLLGLLDLSKSRNLKWLYLRGCSRLELHGRDIEMLSKLPLLRTVVDFMNIRFTLDLVRQKVQIRDWHGKEQERDLGAPPIKIRDFDEDYLKQNGFTSVVNEWKWRWGNEGLH